MTPGPVKRKREKKILSGCKLSIYIVLINISCFINHIQAPKLVKVGYLRAIAQKTPSSEQNSISPHNFK